MIGAREAWLKAQKEIASIDVPKEATVGATAKLELQAGARSSNLQISGRVST